MNSCEHTIEMSLDVRGLIILLGITIKILMTNNYIIILYIPLDPSLHVTHCYIMALHIVTSWCYTPWVLILCVSAPEPRE